MAEAESMPRKRRLSGTNITVIVVAALLTLVPGAAVAVVSATHSVLVDPKTGSPAYVTNHQLNVRGTVGMASIVPTKNVTIYRVNSQLGKPLNGPVFLQGDNTGLALEIGSINLTGYTLNGDLELFLFTRDVTLPGACVSNPTVVGPGSPGVFFEGLNPGGGSAHQVSWTFPIPMVVEPQANKRTCLYAEIYGYSDTEQITLVGAWGTTR